MAGPCIAAEPPSDGTHLPQQGSAKFYQRWHGPAALSLCPKGFSGRFSIRVHRRPGMPSVVAAGGGTWCPDPKPTRNFSPAHTWGRCGPEAPWCKHEVVCTPIRHCKPNSPAVCAINHEFSKYCGKTAIFSGVWRIVVSDLFGKEPWATVSRNEPVRQHGHQLIPDRPHSAGARGPSRESPKTPVHGRRDYCSAAPAYPPPGARGVITALSPAFTMS